ncbi:MAG TPA: polysaccharide lyase family protein [Candidatus Dormibacteraeota bacterium]|jgi:alpha-mannosidase|nr:polysaccharide lyase family protein [Candidatus Dormibacteraeota bacterium]
MNFKSIFLLGSLVSSLCLSATVSAQQGDVVWRLGTFDDSSVEFRDGYPKSPVTYVIDRDRPGSWYAYAPALFPSAKSTTENSPRAIQFQLQERINEAYRLKVSLLIEHSSVPALRVLINGHSGTFYLRPSLDYSMGDGMAAFYPAYSHAIVEFDVPQGLFHLGMNTIALQALAISKEGDPDAGFNYDAIELSRISSRSPEPSVFAEPTIFFQHVGDAYAERVAIFVRYAVPPKSGSVDFELGGRHYGKPLVGGQDFGEERIVFDVPEFGAGTKVQLQLRLNGHSTHFIQILDPQKKWTLYVVPHVHLDIGYTDYQAKVSAIHARILDEAMDLTAKHPAFRFSADGEWILEQFLKNRSPEEKQRLIDAIQHRRIFIPAQQANLLTGFPTAETLIRSLYPSANFSRKNGTPFDYANITDVPSYSWSYASILAAAGIPYFLAGSNNDRAPVLLQGKLNQNTPMYWEGPDKKKVLFWYSRHYEQMQFLFGLPPLVATGEEVLPLFLQMYQRPEYRANAAIIFGTQVENTDLFPQQAELADRWNAEHAYPHVEYSGFRDALEAIAKQFGDNIPTLRGDGGPYWEDGIGADAFYAAMERENESRAPSAEKFSTISSLVNPRIAVDPAELGKMWSSMALMDEHTWLSADSVSDPTSDEARNQLSAKDSLAIDARSQRDSLLRSSLASLADSINAPVGSVLVFNSLNWKRHGLVNMDLDKDSEIVDRTTDSLVPFSVLREGNGFRRVEFLAKDVPAVGYKVFFARRATTVASDIAATSATTLESKFYRVELDPASGAVKSIFDKQLGKELVDLKSQHRFGQYLYVSGGDKEPNSILQYRAVSPPPELQIHPASNGHLISTERTPYGWRARMESTTENTPKLITEIRLFENEKKIEFIESVTKNDVLAKEAVYFAFPFAMSHPQFQYEIQNGVVDPSKDMYPGAGHDWFSVQHWVSVSQDGVTGTVMPLDAPLVTLGDINRGAWPMEFGERPGTIFSYAMNNYWHTNYRASQSGDFCFRYVVTSGAGIDAATLGKMGWEEFTPLERDEITSQDKALDVARPFDGKEASFLQIGDARVLFETWKPAEDGHGTVVRLLDLGGEERTVKISTPLLKLDRVFQTDAVERNQKGLPLESATSFSVEIHPHEILTLRLQGTPAPTLPSE